MHILIIKKIKIFKKRMLTRPVKEPFSHIEKELLCRK
jgi:hypothetical protein